jgi:hypothetical protein
LAPPFDKPLKTKGKIAPKLKGLEKIFLVSLFLPEKWFIKEERVHCSFDAPGAKIISPPLLKTSRPFKLVPLGTPHIKNLLTTYIGYGSIPI